MDKENFNKAYKKLLEYEGGYTDAKNQVKDEPTNMGIRQSTMDKYAEKHPKSNFPKDVKYLTASQAREIYKSQYWDNTNIPKIENERIRNAVFDMNVMSGISQATKTAQRAINNTYGNIAVDGILGKNTVCALNSISSDDIETFMNVLKSVRLEFLRQTRNWETAKNSWIARTNSY